MLIGNEGGISSNGLRYLFDSEVVHNGFRLYFSNKVNDLRKLGKLSWQEGMSSDWVWDISTGNAKETGLSTSLWDSPQLSIGQKKEIEVITKIVRIALYLGVRIPELDQDTEQRLKEYMTDDAVNLEIKKIQSEVAEENPGLNLNPTDMSSGSRAWMGDDLRQLVNDILDGRALIA